MVTLMVTPESLHFYRITLGHPGADEVVTGCEIPVLFEESIVSNQTLHLEASNQRKPVMHVEASNVHRRLSLILRLIGAHKL